MEEEKGEWVTIEEFLEYHMNGNTKEVRKKAATKVSLHKIYDTDGNLVSEFERTNKQPEKTMRINIHSSGSKSYHLFKNGKLHNRAISSLYRITFETKKRTLNF